MIKHISVREWRHMHKKKTINPEELTEAEKERCFVPQWAVGAVDALHEASEDYSSPFWRMQTSLPYTPSMSLCSQEISSWLEGSEEIKIGTY